MALADSLKPLAHRIRAIPGRLGIRPYRIHVVIGEWSGAVLGEGVGTSTTLEITEHGGYPPKVRFLNDEEIAIGSLPRGSVEVGPITPDHAGGGTSWATLAGAAAERGETVTYVLTGPEFPTGARFQRTAGQTDRALHYKITLQPMSES